MKYGRINMNTIEEEQVVEEILKKLILACRLQGVEFITLDKQTRELLITAFRVGVVYWEGKIEERMAKILKTAEISF